MATIVATGVRTRGDIPMVETLLDGADTFTFNKDKGIILILRNPTAGSLTVNIDGDASISQFASGVGHIDLTAGYTAATIPAGDARVVVLPYVSSYLRGSIDVTGGAGIVATLLETGGRGFSNGFSFGFS